MPMTRFVRRTITRRSFRIAAAAFVLPPVLLALYAWFAPLPAPETAGQLPGTVVLAADGTVLQRDTRDGIRIPVTLDAIAPVMIDATIAAEDQRFRSHPGIDVLAMARAAVTWHSNPSGASTITQQLARRLYLSDGGGPLPIRKAREAVLALQLEHRRSKDEILALYLNSVYYGRGAYGIEAAARVYFGVSAANLDLAQAAFLAGLPQLPAAYDPEHDMAAAKARQAYVLGRLRDTGRIAQAQQDVAAAEDLVLVPALAPAIAPHAVLFALDELARVRPDLAGRLGLVIETTLDASLQGDTERIARQQVEKLKDRDASNAAVVAIDPGTGAIRAMLGSVGFDDERIDGQVNVALSARQPGSALKPFLYALAFERGFTAASPLLDVPTTFDTPTGPYSPQDYDRRFHGIVTLRTALASSFNVPAVRTLDQLGVPAFLDIAHRFGLRTLTDAEIYGLALTLGGGEVRLLDLTAAYAALADGGQLREPFIVARVRDASGRVLYERHESPPNRVLDARLAWLLGDILSDAAARIPGFGEYTPLETSFKAAVKTGTTTGFKDNWTLGFTPALAVGAWVGNTDGRPMRDVSGVDGAGPIWRDVMEAGNAGSQRWYPQPAGLERVTVCMPTGLLPGPDCPARTQEWFVSGTAPKNVEHYYVRATNGQLLVDPPVEARAWAADAGFALASGGSAASAAAVQVVEPSPGSVFFLAPELRSQEVLLRAVAGIDVSALEVRVDGRLAIRSERADASVAWPLEPGTHRIEAVAVLGDGRTVRATSSYEVRQR